MMTEEERILVERYLMEELTEAEQAAILSRMETDSRFREEADEIRQAIEAVRDQHRSVLYEKFKSWDAELDRPSGPSGRWAWWLVLPILVGVTGWLVWRYSVFSSAREQAPINAIPLPDSAGERRERAPSPPMAQADEPKESLKPVDRKGKRNPDHGALFAEYYRPYKDPLLNPEMRGTGDGMMDVDSFRLSYWEGRYADAVARFNRLPNESRQAENDLFCFAGALLATGRSEEAAEVLEGMIRRGKSIYVTEARFTLAMARLRLGDLEATRSVLQEYLDDPRAMQRTTAERVIQAISD